MPLRMPYIVEDEWSTDGHFMPSLELVLDMDVLT